MFPAGNGRTRILFANITACFHFTISFVEGDFLYRLSLKGDRAGWVSALFTGKAAMLRSKRATRSQNTWDVSTAPRMTCKAKERLRPHKRQFFSRPSDQGDEEESKMWVSVTLGQNFVLNSWKENWKIWAKSKHITEYVACNLNIKIK